MYSQKAFEILSSSINSAIFIDEKAKDLFSETPVDINVPEEKLSRDLYQNFRDNGKSLAVHRFEPSNLENPNILDFLFNGKDLILLDWELAEVAGEAHSLRLLKEAIKRPYLNFCCIYSNSQNFNNIPLFLDTYFSGLSKSEFENIRDYYSYIDVEEIEKVYGKSTDEITLFFLENHIEVKSFPIDRINTKSIELVFRYIYISLSLERYMLPDDIEEYEVLNTGNDSFIVNNTFVFTLKKDTEEDNDYQKLLYRISEAVILNEGSFFQLLGLEMKSIFNNNEKFIDDEILKSSTEALFQFRNHIDDDKTFGIIIKRLLLEQATLRLRTAKLKLLEPEFLDFKSKELTGKTPTLKDLFQLNVFYNSVSVKSLNDENIPNLNFGDVFKNSSSDEYYLCVTALCDCFRPKDGNFYFVKGFVMKNIELSIKLGDGAFISYLPNSVAVNWGNLESAKFKPIDRKLENESGDEYRIRKLSNEIEGYKEFLYKPFYIQPRVYNVKNNKLINNKISICQLTNDLRQVPSDHDLLFFEIEYVSTLRSDYAQRIANHAFGHPARVGVDFVKI